MDLIIILHWISKISSQGLNSQFQFAPGVISGLKTSPHSPPKLSSNYWYRENTELWASLNKANSTYYSTFTQTFNSPEYSTQILVLWVKSLNNGSLIRWQNGLANPWTSSHHKCEKKKKFSIPHFPNIFSSWNCSANKWPEYKAASSVE